MHESVKQAFLKFNEPLEGRVHWPYLDVRGLVTVGVGNLIDPVSLALGLPWVDDDGKPVPSDIVRSDWSRLKASTALAQRHYKYAREWTSIRLTDEAIDTLVLSRMQSNEDLFTRQLPNFAAFPADAQLAIHSLAWAIGAGFPRKFPNFTGYCNAQDWWAAAVACEIRSDGNPGVIPRNTANQLCLNNAALVQERGLPIEELHWPESLTAPEDPAAEPTSPVISTRPATLPMPTIRLGMQGLAVQVVQHLVGADTDGDFGPLTEAAVKRRQRELGLDDDGVVGDATWRRIASLKGVG